MIFPEDLRNHIKAHIAERCGLYFRDHDLRNLEAAVFQRMKDRGFDSAHAYYIYLTTDLDREAEFRDLLNLLTINHTYFFRNEPQFLALKEKVLPELLEMKQRQAFEGRSGKKPTLRIWSAGCSTGEEPYTIAMVLRTVIENPEDWEIEIYATDASSDAIAKAKQGVYGDNAMRLVEEPYRSRFFKKTPISRGHNEWRISDEIKSMVRFGFLNLVRDPFPPEVDVIFCRNVTIYFELKTTVKVIGNFFDVLADPGYLFLGYSESLQFITDKFRMLSWQESIYYRKATALTEPLSPEFSGQAQKAENKEDIEESPLLELAPIEGIPEKGPESLSDAEFENIRKKAIRYIYLKEYKRALGLLEQLSIEGREMADINYLVADVYTSQGRLADAQKRLKHALQIDPLFAPAHYLLGCIYLEEGDSGKAKESLQKALYLDKDLVMARFFLAQVFRGEGRVQDAIREYRNTLAVLAKGLEEPKSRLTLQSGGFSEMTLKSVCRDNLERLKLGE